MAIVKRSSDDLYDDYETHAGRLGQEIDRLEAEVERLREALDRIARLTPMPALDPHDTQARCRRLAQAALNG